MEGQGVKGFSIKYYRMDPGVVPKGRGLIIRLFSRLAYCAYWRRGFWWFRIFDAGLSYTNSRIEQVLFSQRHGLKGFKVGRWHFKWLRRECEKGINNNITFTL